LWPVSKIGAEERWPASRARGRELNSVAVTVYNQKQCTTRNSVQPETLIRLYVKSTTMLPGN
jgi:hypothetical protein